MTLALNDVLALGASEVVQIDMSTVVLVVIAIACAVIGRSWVAGRLRQATEIKTAVSA